MNIKKDNNFFTKVLIIILFSILVVLIYDGIKDRLIATLNEKAKTEGNSNKETASDPQLSEKEDVNTEENEDNNKEKDATSEKKLAKEEETNDNLLVTLFFSNIKQITKRFYSHYINQELDIYNNEVNVVEIEEIDNIIYITFGNTPKIGETNPVGYDEITYMVDQSGVVTLDKFKHLKSYELPEEYQEYIIKQLTLDTRE